MSDATLYETIAIALASKFRNGEVGFTGLTTGPRAVLYGTSIPLAAMAFARETHAPDLTLLLAGWSVNPDLTELRNMPDLEFGHELLDMRAEAHVTGYPNPIGYKRGTVDFGFSSGAQVDRYGSVNSVVIGDYRSPKVRLVGPILQPEHFTKFGREFIMMPRHDRHTFVEQVDFRSGVGHVPNREELGLTPGTGPAVLVSPLGFFDFDGPQRTMRAVSLNPGVSTDDVREATGFEVDGLDAAQTIPAPSAEELSILRKKVDPRGVLLGGGHLNA